MGLEAGDTIEDLVVSNPTGDDPTNQGNDHLQLLKVVLKNIFPGGASQGFAIPITSTELELNSLVDINGNVQELLDDETSARMLADNNEATTRLLADDALDIRIDNEETARIAADDAEAIIRGDADTVLQGNIDTLSVDTGNAFDAVQVTTDALDSRISDLEGSLEAASGTSMLFTDASAPTGWTQSSANNDRIMRITSGTGGGQAGTSNPISNSHTHTTAAVALTEAQLASHNHGYSKHNVGGVVQSGAGITVVSFNSQSFDTQNTGSGSTHSHGNTGNNAWSPRYVNVVNAVKD